MTKATKALAVLCVVACVGLVQAASPQLRAEIPFKFFVAGQEMPAGTYHFAEKAGVGAVTLTDSQTKKTMIIPIITSISSPVGEESAVVFDKVGDQYYLSELHIPGADGFLFEGARAQHTHVSVPASQQ